MARPVKNTVDYFPHYVNHKKTIFILERQYGNNGYAFWFKLLEQLSLSENHFIDLNNESDFEFLVAKMGVSGPETTSILNLLAKLNAIDRELWQNKLIWCQNFINNITDVYKKRGSEIPQKPVYSTNNEVSGSDNEVSGSDNPQSKVKYIKVNKNTIAANAADEVFNFNNTLKNWIEGDNKIYSLIGKFFRYKDLTFATKDQMQIAAKRHLRAAKELQFFTEEQIEDTLQKIMRNENLRKEFTIETILKYLAK